MKRRDFSIALGGLPLLAGLAQPAAAQPAAPVEGQHYHRLPKGLPTAAGKIEVIEFFLYGCPHCLAFEPAVEAWAAKLPKDVLYRKVHVGLRRDSQAHQRLFCTLEALGVEAKARPAIFQTIQVQRQLLLGPEEMAPVVAKATGVAPAKFLEAYKSFAVEVRCRAAATLQESYGIANVPALTIGGRYLTAPSIAPAGQPMSEQQSGLRALAVADHLIGLLRKSGGR